MHGTIRTMWDLICHVTPCCAHVVAYCVRAMARWEIMDDAMIALSGDDRGPQLPEH